MTAGRRTATGRGSWNHPGSPDSPGGVVPVKKISRGARAAGIAALVVCTLATPAVSAGRTQIDKAEQQRLAVQRELDKSVAAYEAAETKLARTRDLLRASRLSLAEAEAHLQSAQARIAVRASLTYKQGSANMFAFLLGSTSFGDFTRKLTLVGKVAGRDAAQIRAVEQARGQTEGLRQQLDERESSEKQLVEELSARTGALKRKFAEAQALEKRLTAEREAALRAEKRRKETAAAAGAAAEAARPKKPPETKKPAEPSKPPAQAAPAAKPAGALRCPVDGPHSFTDTYGQPREGGRRHQGVDIFAAQGTPTVAVTEAVVHRKDSSAAGGISLVLRGTNGTDYFYTHLSGYAGISVGQKVAAGQRVGYVGATGNASTTAPHLHFEVHPNGGPPINPYPTAKSACG